MSSLGGSPKKAPPTAQERALSQVGAEKFNDYLDNGVPRILQTRDAIQATGAKFSDAALAASAGVEQAGAAQRPRFAVPTGGGRDGFARSDYDAVLAGAKASALTGAREGVTDLETQGEQKLAAFGRKLSDDTQLSLTESGRRATDAAVADAERKFEWSQTKASAVAGLGGAALGAYGQYKQGQREDRRIAALAKATSGGK